MDINSLFFSLLRLGAGLNDSIELPVMNRTLWASVFSMAQKQAVAGIFGGGALGTGFQGVALGVEKNGYGLQMIKRRICLVIIRKKYTFVTDNILSLYSIN